MSPESIEWYEEHRLEIPPRVLPEHLWQIDRNNNLKSAAQRLAELSDHRRAGSLKIIKEKWG